jgi:AmmeMemoRadiSam system protein B
MRNALLLAATLASAGALGAQASLRPPDAPAVAPTLEETRQAMGIPSRGDLRGQQDAVGFASRADQMAKVWEWAAQPPAPESLGPRPSAGVAGAICPHDDYLYAARVYREVLPLVTARTVVLVGVFHKYRRYKVKDALVFDPYRAWRAPDGEIPVSPLREVLIGHLPKGDVIQDAADHDSEHSVEAIAYWLKHIRPDLQIVPILVPSASFPRFQELASRLGQALAGAMKARGWTLGRDLAIVISSDGIHYGQDFHYAPYGDGGVTAFTRAMDRDRELLRGPLAGPVSAEKARAFFEAAVNPARPDEYRMPWCGRFSIPFGLLLMGETSRALGLEPPVGMPVAFGASVDVPELPVRPLGMGPTAPASLYHFVSYPAVAYVAGGKDMAR